MSFADSVLGGGISEPSSVKIEAPTTSVASTPAPSTPAPKA